jgi:hypothetical protein
MASEWQHASRQESQLLLPTAPWKNIEEISLCGTINGKGHLTMIHYMHFNFFFVCAQTMVPSHQAHTNTLALPKLARTRSIKLVVMFRAINVHENNMDTCFHCRHSSKFHPRDSQRSPQSLGLSLGPPFRACQQIPLYQFHSQENHIQVAK